jgi:methionyl-tRNA formyltransferase
MAVPFVAGFRNRLPGDHLMVFLVSPGGKGNVFRIIARNRKVYLIKKAVQFVSMSVRPYLKKLYPGLRPMFINEVAERDNIEYRVISDVNAVDTVELVKKNRIDLLVTFDCGAILRKELISAPVLGSVNVHASLLPKYRGTSPIYWVVRNRERETGITVHLIEETIDTGDIVLQERIDIERRVSENRLARMLSVLGAEALYKVIQNFRMGQVEKVKQGMEGSTYYSNLRRIY